ncbi:hypothetical protein J2S37_001293 [Corynebacterium felinum]|uniref:Uncharacterized protein n=1 Tax=Corynebacterium felinum TaxID=131318 RepID=A0ABU2B805_9CORY|nr:hypothetical protein [Corynebacterium felinum]
MFKLPAVASTKCGRSCGEFVRIDAAINAVDKRAVSAAAR